MWNFSATLYQKEGSEQSTSFFLVPPASIELKPALPKALRHRAIVLERRVMRVLQNQHKHPLIVLSPAKLFVACDDPPRAWHGDPPRLPGTCSTDRRFRPQADACDDARRGMLSAVGRPNIVVGSPPEFKRRAGHLGARRAARRLAFPARAKERAKPRPRAPPKRRSARPVSARQGSGRHCGPVPLSRISFYFRSLIWPLLSTTRDTSLPFSSL